MAGRSGTKSPAVRQPASSWRAEFLSITYGTGAYRPYSDLVAEAAEAARLDVDFSVIVTAERARFYKPHPSPCQLALRELNLKPEQYLFVAGSPYDLPGTAAVGLPTFWHNRLGLKPPTNCPVPRWEAKALSHMLSQFEAESA